MEVEPISRTRYLGCSGNVPIFSDDLAAAGWPKADDQEPPAGSADGKENTESTSAIAA